MTIPNFRCEAAGKGKDQEGVIWGSFTAPNDPLLSAPSLSSEEREGRGGIGGNLGYFNQSDGKPIVTLAADGLNHGSAHARLGMPGWH